MPAHDLLALIFEVLSWVGLGIGLVVLIAALAARAADAGWREVEVVLVRRAGEPPVARWFTADALHERTLSGEEAHRLHDVADTTGYATAGGRLRFERRSHASRVFWLLAVILLGVGLVSLVGGLVVGLLA